MVEADLQVGPDSRSPTIGPDYSEPQGTVTRVVARVDLFKGLVRADPLRRSINVQVIVSSPAGPSLEEHHERAWEPAEVARWLSEAGFVIRGVYDAATLRPAVFGPPRAVVVAQRT